jgi:hypothetical protein
MEIRMLTADPASRTPVPSHPVKVVDNSTAVNSESHFETIAHHGFVSSSRIAKLDSTDAIDALREFDAEPFAVTVNGRLVMMPAPPALPLPHPFIETTRRDGVWVPVEYLQ